MTLVSAYLALTIWTYLLYRNSLAGPFLFDDLAVWSSCPYQYLNPANSTPHPLLLFFQYLYRDIREGHPIRWLTSRPLTYLTYNLNAYYSGLNPRGWHIVNLILHTISGWLAYTLAAHWLTPTYAMFCAALFVAHPMLTMSVSYITGRSSLLCGIFVLLALISYTHHQITLTVLFSFLGFISKEEAVMIPIFVGGLWWLRLA